VSPVLLDGRTLDVTAVAAVAAGAPISLSSEARRRMEVSAAAWARQPDILVQKRRFLVGESERQGEDLVASFILAHCAGVGTPLPDGVVRATIACRANALAVGASGVRPALVDALAAMLEGGALPVVPSQGSVGAAGDLAPLAHIARVLFGLGGEVRTAGAATGPGPHGAFVPTSKEALSLINGATLSTALAAIAVHRAERVLGAMEVACAMTMTALRSSTDCLSPGAHVLRPHPGAVAVAGRLRAQVFARPGPPDAFSIRAAPAVLGAARDALGWVRDVVTRELNAACDNPLWVGDEGAVEVGHFHGAPIALAMDLLRPALTQAAAQSERRTFRLTHGSLNGDLPSFLVQGTGLNSGFMLAQYTAASLVSECKGLSHPAVVDTIPTVQHHEDHVSMAPIAGRLALRVLECVADVVAIEVLLAAQALEFRRSESVRGSGGEEPTLPGAVDAARRAVRERVPFWTDDRVLHPALATVGELVRAGVFSGGDVPW
jgi:histidine ammonia-lyase